MYKMRYCFGICDTQNMNAQLNQSENNLSNLNCNVITKWVTSAII